MSPYSQSITYALGGWETGTYTSSCYDSFFPVVDVPVPLEEKIWTCEFCGARHWLEDKLLSCTKCGAPGGV